MPLVDRLHYHSFMNKRRFALLALYVLASTAWATPKVLIVSPEQTGILQTGGLAHATTGLAVSMNKLGVHADVLMPHYLNGGSRLAHPTGEKIAVDLDWRGGVSHKQSQFTVLLQRRPLNSTLFLRHDTIEGQVNYFDNRGEGRAHGPKGYGPDPTLGESFGAFSKAAAEYILSKDYDVVILSDWTTGLIAVHLHEARRNGLKVPKVVFAIHNIAYQGNFPYSLAEFLGLSPHHFTMDGYEFYGQMSFIKAGMMYSDATYTVSQKYSQEIATPRFGAGLDGVVRYLQSQNRIFGFLNGIIESEWEPIDFDRLNLSGKIAGKAELQAQLGLSVNASKPLFILTSRLAEQKGFDYLINAIDAAAALGDSQWAITGDGEQRFVDGFRELELRYPESVRYQPFSSSLEKALTRYGDFAVNGAWFEPSGQNQFFAMKNGTIPLVSAVGGLVDSIKPGQTGFMFDIVPGKNGEAFDREATGENAFREFRRATEFFHQPLALRKMRLKVMGESHSWDSRIKADFLPFFDTLLGPAECEPELLPKP